MVILMEAATRVITRKNTRIKGQGFPKFFRNESILKINLEVIKKTKRIFDFQITSKFGVYKLFSIILKKSSDIRKLHKMYLIMSSIHFRLP